MARIALDRQLCNEMRLPNDLCGSWAVSDPGVDPAKHVPAHPSHHAL